jgi:hypothetical protein
MKFLFALILIIIPFQTSAQLFSSIEEKAIIELKPEFPAPKEMVTATVKSSYFEDLKRATIVWSIDGAERKREIGGTTFQFQAPEAGRNMELFVTVDRVTSTFANFINLKTANLDLIYEANTYTPPFYKGRTLYTPQASIKIAALATMIENGSQLPKNRIIYNWYKNDEKISELSGLGKDSAVFQGDLLSRPFYVSVIAESLNSDLKSKKRILITPTAPKVVLYENNPLFGSVFEKALTGTFNFDREEVGITAVPYFFSADQRGSGSLKYSWYENGKTIGNETFGSFINYLNPNKEKNGVSNLEVRVDHSTSFLQSGNNSFKINVLGNQQSDTMNTNESISF